MALALLLAAGGARAEGWYLGASVGLMDNDIGGFDDATNAGALLGYDVFSHGLLAISLEGELTTTVSDGDISSGGMHGNWNIDTQAAYVAARLGERVYMKVRWGVLREDASARIDGVSRSDSDSGGSWGGALGFMLTPQWAMQIDGTLVDSDVNYWSLGVNYHFR